MPSQTETEEEPLMENGDLSSELEPEDENITYGKRYANYNLCYQSINCGTCGARN